MFSALAPGRWFNSVPRDEYERLFASEILAKLDPLRTWNMLHQLAGDAARRWCDGSLRYLDDPGGRRSPVARFLFGPAR